jgi:hypothetical protein
MVVARFNGAPFRRFRGEGPAISWDAMHFSKE